MPRIGNEYDTPPAIKACGWIGGVFDIAWADLSVNKGVAASLKG
jgi:hypothetical protein